MLRVFKYCDVGSPRLAIYIERVDSSGLGRKVAVFTLLTENEAREIALELAMPGSLPSLTEPNPCV